MPFSGPALSDTINQVAATLCMNAPTAEVAIRLVSPRYPHVSVEFREQRGM